jgi:hypothetical protein
MRNFARDGANSTSSFPLKDAFAQHEPILLVLPLLEMEMNRSFLLFFFNGKESLDLPLLEIEMNRSFLLF